MKIIQRTLVEKAGNDHGFENSYSYDDGSLELSSARHQTRMIVQEDQESWLVNITPDTLIPELKRSFSYLTQEENTFILPKQQLDQLSQLIQKTTSLTKSRQNTPVQQFQEQVEAAVTELRITGNTEVERMVKQRIGQQSYREALMAYWGNACAVTGISVPEVLRASHAKPWADCATNEERLDVYNGFLLSANLDALFDRFLISFTNDRQLIISNTISEEQRDLLGLTTSMHLRWIDQQHLPYLQWHREKLK